MTDARKPFLRLDNGEELPIKPRGYQLMSRPMLNRGTAFTHEERTALGLTGLLPPGSNTLEMQVRRVYAQYQSQGDDLSKNVFLTQMRDRNEVLFYRLLSEHLEEMLPIVYTPTIGQAIELYSDWYSRPRGVYLSIDRPEEMEDSLSNYGLDADEVDLVVVTDSEGILGIGDQGVGGIAITTGKLAVYTAAAGIHPRRSIPIVLDVGTDNLRLLNNDNYLGERHARVRGERYDEFIDRFVQVVSRMFPGALLHWEDFAADNAHRILAKYRGEHCTFNDDIQGTAAVVLAAALAGVQRIGSRMADQRIVVYGAGSAGVGIAEAMRDVMVSEGLSREEANRRFWCLGSRGLITQGMGSRVRDFQEPYARPDDEVIGWASTGNRIGLLDVVQRVQPTILIGTSAQAGAFTQEVVTEMAKHTARPIIMPLSNPTPRAEAKPVDIVSWTDGRALIATGSPFAPVRHGDVVHYIAQANNALVFPGLGLGVSVSKASRVSDRMIEASARAVADMAQDREPGAPLLPSVDQLRTVSAAVALAVCKAAAKEDLARVELTDPVQQVFAQMWQPTYAKIVL
ncbi:malate dehydrogenase (oxaloacetate-decarboxylating) [Kineosphaera limosa]|uniref:Putative malate oxidoreductase [NAD] n=1 Tax=Kineosphaera limosa NBRC 100340 TaxID=1184609 RepID=K6WPW0_9MICO|nr:NAD-dependent malic enzyme [Kineosphaera limosa]NYE02302.1 malate dehydrogenase (oxaloacetate-decarboxylating) [Kineosphaera limosa]GAB94157.1 putative NADP-dependent malic enzyme [Kineosphaera limosa NBRC 100340]